MQWTGRVRLRRTLKLTGIRMNESNLQSHLPVSRWVRNIEHRTPKSPTWPSYFDVRRWTLDVRCSCCMTPSCALLSKTLSQTDAESFRRSSRRNLRTRELQIPQVWMRILGRKIMGAQQDFASIIDRPSGDTVKTGRTGQSNHARRFGPKKRTILVKCGRATVIATDWS